MSFTIESTNPVVKAVIEQTAPRPALLAAARGVLPLPENDLLEVLVAFALGDDRELAGHANATITAHNQAILEASVRSSEIAVSVLNYFASQEDLPGSIHESIISHVKTPVSTIVKFASATKNGELLEIISLNQQLLIQTPAIIDAIIANPHRTPEATRRASETKREFFEKERGVQQIADELRAQGKEAAAEFIEQADFTGKSDAVLDAEDALLLASLIEVPESEFDDSWLGLEFIEELYEETPEQRQAIVDKIIGDFRMDEMDLPSERIAVINRILKMGIKDRARLAVKGDREARNILIRDPNRVVAQAVISNPRISEQEVEKIAAMRSITEDVLRQIASNRQWTRSYSIMHNLARNPRTPIANVLNILSRMQLRDLTALSKNRNVSDAVRRQALRLSQTRTGN
ncbi:MAG: hypothetical protein ACR2M8_08915 [Pyrinomonadaceae bacterium]|nr:hypothetical protein [Blastocatellia bacterium]